MSMDADDDFSGFTSEKSKLKFFFYVQHHCDRFWENRPKRGKQFFSVSPGKVIWVDFFRKFFYGRNG